MLKCQIIRHCLGVNMIVLLLLQRHEKCDANTFLRYMRGSCTGDAPFGGICHFEIQSEDESAQRSSWPSWMLSFQSPSSLWSLVSAFPIIITIIITIFIIITIINLGFGLTLLHRQPSGSGLPRTLVGTGVSEGVTGNNYYYFDPGWRWCQPVITAGHSSLVTSSTSLWTLAPLETSP